MRKNNDEQQHIVCYMPVLHMGYVEFFAKYPDAVVHILGDSVLARFDYLRKDIRALSPTAGAEILHGMKRDVHVVEEKDIRELLQETAVIMPDDDISHTLIEEFRTQKVRFEPIFLRWDRNAIDTNQEISPDRTVNLAGDDPTIAALYKEAAKSTNWWRSVGAALVSDDELLALAHNGSVPTEYSSAIDGDPRIVAKRGEAIDTTIDIHAESRLIGWAARLGKSLSGKTIFVTTFPCATCAKLISASGITHCYYIEGYASVDGQSILQANGIEIVKIETNPPKNNRQKLKSYRN